MYLMVLVLAVLSVATFQEDFHISDPYSSGFFSNWTNPENPTLRTISDLEHAGVTVGYADYWVAYDLDFLSR